MKKYCIWLAACLFSAGVTVNLSYAAESAKAKLVSADKIVSNLSTTLTELNKKASIPVLFPTRIPQEEGIEQYYANIERPHNSIDGDYLINIDATSDCNGARVCNLGYLRAQQGGKPERLQNQAKQDITVAVSLANHIQGYFTPGHAMGSFFPALLEWQKDGVLYSLSWNLPPAQEKRSLIEMANTAILGS